MASDEAPDQFCSNDHDEVITRELTRYRDLRMHRYSSVNVLILTWEHGDKPAFEKDAEKVAHMFKTYFNYTVHVYKIPSVDSETLLNAYVANFVRYFGGEERLIIVYYGGHGGQKSSKDTSCEWAALISGGPTVDWSLIQPQFLLAGCDVIMLLDCCYAGQAIRGRITRSFEFLAATDKDIWTPVGTGNWPSFTDVLVREMSAMLEEEKMVTMPGLHQRMVGVKAGLLRQPFYASLTSENPPNVARLARLGSSSLQSPNLNWHHPGSLMSARENVFLNLRLRLYHPLDSGAINTFIRWVTRDSPSFIADIELERVVLEARAAGTLAEELTRTGASSNTFAWSEASNREVTSLLHALNESILTTRPGDMNDIEIYQALTTIKQNSDALIAFVTTCLTSLSPQLLQSLQAKDIPSVDELKARIAMRLTLLNTQKLPNTMRVSFNDQPLSDQRLRLGRWNNITVIVEYIYYDAHVDVDSYARMSAQVAKVSALHAEPKSPAFRTLRGLGYSHEVLHGPRFGFVYDWPFPPESFHHEELSRHINRVKHVPLEWRFRLALALCGAVVYLHSIGWLHKGLKSDNVILFPKRASSEGGQTVKDVFDFENPYLIGFDCSRPDDAETWATMDFDTTNNIYRHPDRWGRPLRFEKHHELYALGLLLLEIGCWRTLPNMDSKRNEFRSVKNPETLRDFFLNVVDTKLAHDVGSKYANLVRKCLERTDWKSYEDWQFQKILRQDVYEPLSKC